MTKYEKVIAAVFEELKRAEEEYPMWPDDIVHAAAIVGEEAGELIRASIDWYYGRGNSVECRKEAIQTAAMALRFLFALAKE